MHTLLPNRTRVLPSPIGRLHELAYNLWFSWNDEAIHLFSSAHPSLWEQAGHNPVRWLQEIDDDKLVELSQDLKFIKAYHQVMDKLDLYLDSSSWFQRNYPDQSHMKVAYFSAEFGFHESLPIYSGGLGILAGDHCKSASDLGIPLTGVGLLYKKGYFKQKLDTGGRQQVELIDYDFHNHPLQPVTLSGQDLIVHVEMPFRHIALRVWCLQAGRIPIYLLDADVDTNSLSDRQLTSQLYGGNQDTRIAQEIILGIGGVKALRALGIDPHVYHINEGHAAFLSLERLKELMNEGLPFRAALEAVRSGTVFTTHTPVPAGHDAFAMDMVLHYLGPMLHAFGDNRHLVLELGLDKISGLFNMTHLALNTASLRNGVSKLHGHVSRELFRGFHGSLNTADVPITSITNGVHLETWLAKEWKELFDQFLPNSWREDPANANMWSDLQHIPYESIWNTHITLKETLIVQVRRNLREQRIRNGEPQERIVEIDSYLSPKVLTIGFARRFATYKRANLIFNDLQRLARLVNSSERPIQIIFAGKAHPADVPGQELIRTIYKVSQMEEFAGKIVLLENYDMALARSLVQGVDVWLNNPRRPLEASGTSGQKAAMNGVLNFSVLDGWWEEGYNGNNGWAIGSSEDIDEAIQEREHTASIYRILESEIIPLYYHYQDSLPVEWINCMKNAIYSLSPAYNTHRMVQDYVDVTYVPSAERAARFKENHYYVAIQVADYKKFIRENWHHVKIITVDDRSSAPIAPNEASKTKTITADVFFGPIWPPDTVVEVVYYEESCDNWEQVVVPMQATTETTEQSQRYKAEIPVHLRHGPHFSVRVRPISANFSHSFELPLMTSTLKPK